ncbi:hypothetical protein CUC53_08605 [Aeromonas cavernicola]|uniref:Uncharacterized protein n=1 Tax=Aeromonas cavernicola TaxID=1006623 RepID=A0A2H9U571_9GAMM|nr:hypothetical protein CUC53_08605 [Aeromonas cavernicola]
MGTVAGDTIEQVNPAKANVVIAVPAGNIKARGEYTENPDPLAAWRDAKNQSVERGEELRVRALSVAASFTKQHRAH